MALTLTQIAKNVNTEEQARELLEKLRWPDGIACVHCGNMKVYRLTPKPTSKKPGRAGLLKCAGCRKQFTVTTGSIFEASHIPLSKWVLGINLLCASKKGMSALQFQRMLGISYKAAWFMAHRIRFAMAQTPFAEKLNGIVEADEAYIGPRRPRYSGSKRGHGTRKQAVFALVQRDGDVRTFPIEKMTAQKLQTHIRQNVEKEARIMTDEFLLYKGLGKDFVGHHTVTHATNEYVRNEGDLKVTTNAVEGFFGILKRGISGVYQHVSKEHLHRYLSEFEFRYNNRKITDGTRMVKAVQGFEGKRLMYKDSSSSAS